MKLKRLQRFGKIRAKPSIRMKRSKLAVDRAVKYPMQSALDCLSLEGADTPEAIRWLVTYGFQRALEGEFRFLKEILDAVDGPVE
jgi:hypothetical protein